MKLLESGEMYLETIFRLSKTREAVRSVDVSEYMGYSKPSVSRAVGILRNEGYLTVGEKGELFLTESGRQIAEKIYDRHTILTDFLRQIGVGEENAAADACKMEHDLSDETFEAIKKYVTK